MRTKLKITEGIFPMPVLRKYRYKLLDEVHEKQQSLDAIDYMICKTKK